ncbi:MAG: hypothetical protein AABZ57_03960 [Candidatus Margulisiibacteriota bacterium]
MSPENYLLDNVIGKFTFNPSDHFNSFRENIPDKTNKIVVMKIGEGSMNIELTAIKIGSKKQNNKF